MLSSHSSCLKSKLSSKILQSFFIFTFSCDIWEFTQNWLSFTSAHIGWASSNNTVGWVFSKLESSFFDFRQKLVKWGIDSSQIVTFNNWNNSELILLTNPNHFGFVLTDPDTSSMWPIWGNTWRCQMVVSGHVVEEEMLFYEFIGFILVNEVFVSRCQTMILAWNAKLLENINKSIFESDSFILVHFWW